MKILKKVAVAVSLLVAAFTAHAADVSNLYIHTKSGEKITLRFVDHPTITFNAANALVIKSATTTTMIKGFALVNKITFDKSAGINDAVADVNGEIRPSGVNVVSLTGFKAGTPVSVCSVNGQVLLSFETDGEPVTDISLDNYGKGVYVIAAGDVVCKMAIK